MTTISKERLQCILTERLLKNIKNILLGGNGIINGNASSFIDKMYFEDHYVIFNAEKYFVNGCQTKKNAVGKMLFVRLEVYNLTQNITIFSVTKPSASECISAFEKAAIWNGKSFWEAETYMEWVDE